jgi:mRNA interferase MazF
VVQSDAINAIHASIVVCPLTSDLSRPGRLRIALPAAPATGLRRESFVMVDKIAAVRRERVTTAIGRLSDEDMSKLEASLLLLLGIAERPSRRRA